MSIIIKFITEEGVEISEQQAVLLAEYKKKYIIDGVLKKRERFLDNVLWGGVYYLSSDENLINILQELGDGLWSILSNKQVVNGYTIYEARGYNENYEIKPKFTKLTFDAQERMIAVTIYDSSTSTLIRGYKRFYYDGRSADIYSLNPDPEDLFGEDMYFNFKFNENGDLIKIHDSEDIINNKGYWDNLEDFLLEGADFIEKIMLPGEFEYYTNLLPIEPNF